MTLNQIIEKLKMENAQSMEKHGKWKGRIDEHRQSEAIRNEFCEWYSAYVLNDINGEHGEIEELIDLMNVAARRIMYLTGEDQ